MNQFHKISEVSRIAGISKDLLRMWERRYGYPTPDRDYNGDRVYTDRQLTKLVTIRQLMDQGKRPGKLVSLEQGELESMLKAPKVDLDLGKFIERLNSGDADALQDWFSQQLLAYGLRSFIHKIVVSATREVGEAWYADKLSIHAEHLYTEVITNLLRQSMMEIGSTSNGPRVMLATVPGEQHSLGLLMVETLLRLGGANVVSFGTEMPFRDISEAARIHEMDVIGLSFSAGFKTDDAIVILTGLRQMIDSKIRLWVGGAAFGASQPMPVGVEKFQDLYRLERALAEWKKPQSSATSTNLSR